MDYMMKLIGLKRWWKQPHHPFQGSYKQIKSTGNNDPVDEYEIVALAKRLNITLEDMKNMSFVSLMNILISTVEEKDVTKKATQEDINRVFGQEEYYD